MTFEQENAIRINTSIETNKSISETSRTHRIRWFDKTPKDLSVIRVPIKYLTYNFDNMRIESQLIEEIDNLGSELDFEEQDDREVYAGIFEETLLSGSDKLKTIRLKRSIKNTQQDTPGVITHGGIILDGNRRFMVIKGLFEEERIKNNGNPDKFKYMDVVRLDSGLSKSQLLAIQTLNQLYEIDIVGYTLINQALSIRKLKSFGYEREEIKKMFNFQKVSDVEEFEEILNFIDLFLEENNLQNKYTMIDKRNLFDHFR